MIKDAEITEEDLRELAKQIAEGITGGRLDSETEEGKSKHISWQLIIKDVWVD